MVLWGPRGASGGPGGLRGPVALGGPLGGPRGAFGGPCGAPSTTTTTGVGGAGGRADEAVGKLAGIVTDKGHIREVV